jgi:osmoprotectant transport system permease protein
LAFGLLGAATIMPAAAPLFHALFPDLPHPVYSRASFLELTLAHLQLVGLSSLVAALIGIGLGVFVTRHIGREFAPLASSVAAIGQTFPPIAVLALAIPMLGYGAAPILLALSLYAILPIFEGAVTGLDSIPPAARDAALGMGFSPLQLLLWIELPLALPFILSGLRNAVLINIGLAAIGSSVGALSLGSPIIEGLSAANPAYVIQGASLVALLAIFADRVFERLEKWLQPFA